MLRGDVIYGKPLSLRRRLECVKFYFHAEGIRRLHAALPRSGHLWSELGMRLAIDLAQGGDGEYVYERDLFWPREGLAFRRLDWRIPMGATGTMFERSDGPVFGPQLYFHSRHPYFRIRSAQLRNMKIVVLVRSILDSVESRFVKFAMASSRPTTTLDDPESFDWDRHLGDAIEFYNSWGDALSWHPGIRLCRYEDLKADPVGTHKEILDFWGFDVPVECIAEGFRRASKTEMLNRMPAAGRETGARVSNRSAGNRGNIPAAIKDRILERLQRELVHNLGYEYDADTVYGREYD